MNKHNDNCVWPIIKQFIYVKKYNHMPVQIKQKGYSIKVRKKNRSSATSTDWSHEINVD